MKNIFIPFEGIDGTGKTTHSAKLVQYLTDKGYEVFYLKKIPSQGGWMLDNIALEEKLKSSRNIYGNYSVAIVEAIDRVINENKYILELVNNKNKNIVVIAERYNFGYLAKESRCLCKEEFIKVRKIYERAVQPDYVFYLELNEKEAIKRINSREYGLEQEKELIEYRKAYEMLDDFHKFIKINVDGSIKNTHEKILRYIDNIIELRNCKSKELKRQE